MLSEHTNYFVGCAVKLDGHAVLEVVGVCLGGADMQGKSPPAANLQGTTGFSRLSFSSQINHSLRNRRHSSPLPEGLLDEGHTCGRLVCRKHLLLVRPVLPVNLHLD